MVQPARLGVDVGDEVAQARAAGKLADHEGDELVPPAGRAQFPAPMVPASRGLEFMSRQDFEELGQHGRMVGQGLDPPLFSWVSCQLQF